MSSLKNCKIEKIKTVKYMSERKDKKEKYNIIGVYQDRCTEDEKC